MIGKRVSELFALDEIARAGARRMLIAALKTEADDYIERHRGERDEHGRALVVRNGRAQARKLTLEQERWSCERHGSTTAGAMSNGSASALAARSCRPTCGVRPKSPRCCRSCTCAGCPPAISAPRWNGLLGEDAAGLSPTNIARLTTCWEKEYTAFRQRDLSRARVRLRVGGWGALQHPARGRPALHPGDDRARPDGEKELLAVEDGYRESAESWKTLLRDLKRRGMAAPVLAVGDGALGFWAAAREVWPETREQACWCHKLANVLDKLPKRLQPRAKRALHEMMYAERRVRLRGRTGRVSRPSIRPSTPRRWSRLPPTGSAWLPSSTSPPSIGSTCAPPT